MNTRGVVTALGFVVACACGSFFACSSSAKPETKSPARINDSVPERSAALRSASGLELAQSDSRWGTESAAERKRQQKEAQLASARSNVIPLPPMDGGTLVDAH